MITTTIAEQLTEIYFTEEYWHKQRMSYNEAIEYHQDRLDKGNITVCLENGEVLAYYERYFVGDTCFLHNVFVKREHRRSEVWKWLYKNFFTTMPDNITEVVGEQQKLKGKFISRLITKERGKYGIY